MPSSSFPGEGLALSLGNQLKKKDLNPVATTLHKMTQFLQGTMLQEMRTTLACCQDMKYAQKSSQLISQEKEGTLY